MTAQALHIRQTDQGCGDDQINDRFGLPNGRLIQHEAHDDLDVAPTAWVDLTQARRVVLGHEPHGFAHGRRAEVARQREDLESQLGRVAEAAVITLVGSTGAGKSTLLNALVGRPVATEGTSRPTTTAPVIYRPRDADVRELLDGLPGDPPRVVDYDPDAGGRWTNQILIDAPDTNSVATLHRDVVEALAGGRSRFWDSRPGSDSETPSRIGATGDGLMCDLWNCQSAGHVSGEVTERKRLDGLR